MKIELNFNRTATEGKVMLDGIDITNIVSGISMDLSVGEVVKVTLKLMPSELRVEGDFEVLEFKGPNGEELELTRDR